jgi:hypothetical protein
MRRMAAGFSLAVGLFAAGPAAAQVPAGGELVVNTYTPGYQVYASVARGADGSFVVVWDDRSDYVVKGQRFDRAGLRVGAEFAVSGPGQNYAPAVALTPDSGFVVAWASYPDGSVVGVRARRFDAQAAPVGAEFQVNTYTFSRQTLPNVAVDGGGAFVVAWRSEEQDGFSVGMAARRFSAQGLPLGADFVVNQYTFGNQFLSDISADAAGNFVIGWTSQPGTEGTAFSVDAQRFDAAGARLGANFRLNSYTTGNQLSVGLAHAPDGSFVAAFLSTQNGDGGDVMAKRYAAAGTPIGAEFVVNSTSFGTQGYPDIAMDAQGNFVVAWWNFAGDGSDRAVNGRRFRADGTPRGGDFLVNTYTTGRQAPDIAASTIASDAAGNFVVVWRGPQPTNPLDVFLQRFGGLHPDGLQVDTAGNLVWEPGETVDVRPRWLNVSGAARAFAGTLSGLGGPAGATYTITDGNGSYGTVADGAAAPCADCYAVGVDDPSPRPVQHWDAGVLESLTPDIQGQQKRWALHIGRSFGDVSAASPFYRFVETLLHFSITGGCGGTDYCPGSSTTREQMAVFVLIAKEGAGYAPPPCGTPVFDDVPASSPFCRFIEELARRGVAGGCAPDLYCPADPVTREQMAVFVLRTLDPALTPPACTTPVFADVPAASPFCRWIEELARRNVVTGCAPGLYCPQQPVTREQMGVFISATFGLALYGV